MAVERTAALGAERRELVEGHPHGLVLSKFVRARILKRKLKTRSKRLQLAPPAIVIELARAGDSNGSDVGYPLLLIGLRELRSHNSWMHNSPLLVRGGRMQPLRVHPDDAARNGLSDGGRARLESKSGAIEVDVMVTDEMTPGAVAMPHGLGHRGGGWRLANEQSRANVNLLAGSDPDDLEALAGMSHLSGIPVKVTSLVARADEPRTAVTTGA